MMKKVQKQKEDWRSMCIMVAAVCLCSLIMTIITTVNNSSVPVLLSYDGSFWVDQHGEIIKQKKAERFLENNPEYTNEIIRLNENPYYATSLQNGARSQILEQLRSDIYVKARSIDKTDKNPDLANILFKRLITSNPVSQIALTKLRVRLLDNGAATDIGWIRYCIDAEDLDRILEGSSGYGVEGLFFCTLAKLEETNMVEEVCQSPLPPSIAQIPVIMNNDGDWLDQNAEVMDANKAELFLNTHISYARSIVELNFVEELASFQSKNRKELLEEQYGTVSVLRSFPDSDDGPEDYQWVLDELSIECSSDEAPELIFWIAFDKATKNGALYTEDAVAEQDSKDVEEAVAKKDVKETAEEAEKVVSEIIQKNAKPDTASTKTAAPSAATVTPPKEPEEPNDNSGASNDDETKNNHEDQTEGGFGNFDISHPDVTFDEYGVGRSNIDPSQRYYAYPSGNVYEITDPNFNMDTIGQSSDWQTTGKFAGRTTQQ